MHTEAFFESDEAFMDFTRSHISELKYSKSPSDGSSYVGRLLDSDLKACIAYEVDFTNEKINIKDAVMLPVDGLPRLKPNFCRVKKTETGNGLRKYVTISNPLYHNEYVAIDILSTLGLASDDPKDCSDEYLNTEVLGLALSIQKRTDDVCMTITKGPEVEFNRVYNPELLRDGVLHYNMHSVSSLLNEEDDTAPEAYSYYGVIDSIETFDWFGRKSYMLQLRVHTHDSQIPFTYTLVASEAVLNGYCPCIGESITGTMMMCVIGTEPPNKTSGYYQQFEKAITAYEKAEMRNQKEEAIKSVRKVTSKTYSWGTVHFCGKKWTSFTPNKDFPRETTLGSLELDLPTYECVPKKVSHFASDTLPFFSFYDEFVTLLPKGLSLCNPKQSEVKCILRQLKSTQGMNWNTPKLTKFVGVIQAAQTTDKQYKYYRLAVKPDLSTCYGTILAVYDCVNKSLLRYTLTYEYSNFSPLSLEVCNVYCEKKGKNLPIKTMRGIKAFTSRMEEDDFVILIDYETNEMIQYAKTGHKYHIEFQLGDMAFQFSTKLDTVDEVFACVEKFKTRDPRFYSDYSWGHCVLKTEEEWEKERQSENK